MDSHVTSTLKDFILSAYLFGDESRMPADEDSLLESGVLDSTGVLELIEFLEEKYGIEVADAETVPQNLGSISSLTRYVLGKTGRTAAASVL
jgi:acyl carrier protein